ncbi:hypothetical protein BH11BAC5_BH11BAC5_32800 [soil metagenome]|jgi:plasmid stabilization system protein ParE
MYKIAFRLKALEEYEEGLEWYAQRSIQAAENFVIATKEAIESIKLDPFRQRKLHEVYYEIKLKKYPFTVVYIIETNRIVIISVFHQKRAPGKKYL